MAGGGRWSNQPVYALHQTRLNKNTMPAVESPVFLRRE